MFTAAQARRARLDKLFERREVAQLSDLRRALGVRSRTTVFFALKAAGYYASYSHAGRYYTLRRVPEFDAQGLWFRGQVRFSKHGTLRATLLVLVCESPAGRTHAEIEQIVGLRVHDTLRSLVEAEALGREEVESVYVYLAPEPERAAAQLAQRRRMLAAAPPAEEGPMAQPALDAARIIEILVAVVRAPKADARAIAARLRAAGSPVSDQEVEAVFARYGLEKKTARPRSRRSRR